MSVPADQEPTIIFEGKKMRQEIIYISVSFLMVASSCLASTSVDVDSNFYTPMSTMVISDRDYLLTSNAHAWLDMGSGLQSYETLLFLKFDSAALPDELVERAWIRMASGAGGSMGDSTRPVEISVHSVDMDVMNILNGTVTPRDYYVNSNHILDSVDNIMVYEDGICYWDITDIVNTWILYKITAGQAGAENLGLAVTGRDDYGANDSGDNEHAGFWSKASVEGLSQMVHAAMPSLIIISGNSGFSNPWIPDWQSAPSHTHQQWLFSAVNGRCQQPLTPDGYCFNDFGDPNIVWQEDEPVVENPFVTWHPFVDQVDPNSHPAWVDGVYGAFYRGWAYDEHILTAQIPTGSQPGSLQVFVQYDWYDAGIVDVNVPGGIDITPANYTDYEIGLGENGYTWLRSTKVFELTDNPGHIFVNVTVSGDEPYVDALSVTTAVNAILPTSDLRNAQDVNLDGYVNLVDFNSLAGRWQPDTVGMGELLELAEQWLDISDYIFPL